MPLKYKPNNFKGKSPFKYYPKLDLNLSLDNIVDNKNTIKNRVMEFAEGRYCSTIDFNPHDSKRISLHPLTMIENVSSNNKETYGRVNYLRPSIYFDGESFSINGAIVGYEGAIHDNEFVIPNKIINKLIKYILSHQYNNQKRIYFDPLSKYITGKYEERDNKFEILYHPKTRYFIFAILNNEELPIELYPFTESSNRTIYYFKKDENILTPVFGGVRSVYAKDGLSQNVYFGPADPSKLKYNIPYEINDICISCMDYLKFKGLKAEIAEEQIIEDKEEVKKYLENYF